MSEKSSEVVVPTVCWGGGGGCMAGCGILLHVKDGKLIKVTGDPECPFNQGSICMKPSAFTQVVYHPTRLKNPLIRVGERGEDKWKEISWEEAYNIVVEKFKKIKEKYGPWSIIFCEGTGRDVQAWCSRLAYSIGSPNWLFGGLSGDACYVPRIAASETICGGFYEMDASQHSPDRYDNPEWKPPKYIVIWGKNPVYSNPDGFFGGWVVDCMRRGSRLIVVDPRMTWLASRADVWLQLRPGTDAALALGMLNVIINEKLYDKEFVEKWCYGFDKLKERVQQYTQEKVEQITWVPAEKIEEAAKLYAMNKPSALLHGYAVDTMVNAIPTFHAMTAMVAITGNFEVPGGDVLVSSPFAVYQPWIAGWGYHELLTEEQKQARLGFKEYPLRRVGYLTAHPNLVLETLLTDKPYPIRAAWIQANNMLASMADDPKRWYEALMKLEFIVAVDLFMTPTTMIADLVLPAASTPERTSVFAIWDRVAACNGAVRVGECKSDPEIALELGRRINPEAWPWNTLEEMLDEILKPAGITFEELRKRKFIYPRFEYKRHEKGLLRPDGKPGFNTPTGKIELYSTRFEQWGYDPLPFYEEPPESPTSTPELYGEYPLILLTGPRPPAFFLTEGRQIPWLRRSNPYPLVEIHPETASRLGISDGEWVWIESSRGKCRQKAKLSLKVHPKVVQAQHGWWYPEKLGSLPTLFGLWESNINLVIPHDTYDRRTGFGAAYNGSLCKVYKAGSGEG